MNVLEKILEEIEERRGSYSKYSKSKIGEKSEKEILERITELGYVEEIIRSHMGEMENGGWIPVDERLPEEDDIRFYMCIVENHEEDLPMFCQYNELYGFGFWQDIYDPVTLGFVDTEFKTNNELGYEKVIAWQPLPEPYKGGKE